MRLLLWLMIVVGVARVPSVLADDATATVHTSTATSSSATKSSTDPSTRLRIQPIGQSSSGSSRVQVKSVGGNVQGAGVKMTPAASSAANKYQVKKMSELNQAANGVTTTGGATTSGTPHYQIKRMTGSGATVAQSQQAGSVGLPPRTAVGTTAPSAPATNTTKSGLSASPFRGGRPIGGTRTTTQTTR